MKHSVYALHVGDKTVRRSQFFYRDQSDISVTLSFYFWVVLGGLEPIVFDVAFDGADAEERGLHSYRDRGTMLGALNLQPQDIKTVVMSHLHWDHCSGHALFANANFLVQHSEAVFWDDRAQRHDLIMASANRKELEALADLTRRGRVRLLRGNTQLWPGLDIIQVGGHTPGLQILVAETATKPVILASDTFHYYENYRQRRPVQVTMDFPAALEAFELIEKLGAGHTIVAGHDPMDCVNFRKIADGVFVIA